MLIRLGKYIRTSALTLALGTALAAQAGNEDRAGQAGASHLLINPWARSASWGGANSANQRGLEGQFMNVAGLAFTKKTEVLFANTQWLMGSDIQINAFGLAQRLGKNAGVLGISVTAMSFGNIPVTTTQNPEGTGATYSPRFLNIGISYAKSFSDKIHGGVTVRIINESIANVSASGFCLDAGVQYQTSLGKASNPLKKDNFVFGIALKNIGPKLRYNGDGQSTSATLPTGANLTVDQRSSDFEMPALLNIGIMYRFRFKNKSKEDGAISQISPAFNFTTNSFTRDQFMLGLEYSWNEIIMLRGGYTFEKGIFSNDRSALNSSLLNAFTGPSCGASVDIPLGKSSKEKTKKNNIKFGLDYAYRSTYAFRGVHSFGARFTM